ncbi:MAG: hypothetical protein KatS3mg044_1476 [Rhodothermaceae bacterium]|nr:MAG: hypothetical protein KatS3mg044_1476 [Rhodothermaceae bacterium]
MMRSIGKARGGRRPWGRLLPALLWGMMHAANAQDVDFTVCAESEGVSVPGVSVHVWNGETDVPQASGVTGPDGCVTFRDVPTSVDEAFEVVDGLKVRLDGPNPADSYTRFVIEGRAKKAEVYDVLGRRVADIDLLGDRANVDLNLSSGVYFVRAYSDEGVAVGSFVKVGNSLTRVEFDKQEFTKANDVLSRMSVAKSSSGASLDFLVSSPNHLDIAEGRWVVDGDTLRFEVVEAPTARVKVYQAEDHYKQLSEGVIEVWTPDSTRIVTPDSAGVYNFVIPARRFSHCLYGMVFIRFIPCRFSELLIIRGLITALCLVV